MPMPSVRIAVAGLLAALFLAGCQSAGPGSGQGPIVRQSSGVDGDWLSTDGVAISRFAGGTFETIAADTGNKLATGNYRYTDARTVQIEVTSIIRQGATSSVACALVSPEQLNCTSSTGQQFVLVRRAVS